MKHSYSIQKICKSPEIFVVENFLNSQECEYIIYKYQKYLSNSMTTGGKNLLIPKLGQDYHALLIIMIF